MFTVMKYNVVKSLVGCRFESNVVVVFKICIVRLLVMLSIVHRLHIR